MFLLLLMGLGAASVKAQVTIGADTVPHPGAVLDLHSTTRGLLLPHVALSDVAVFGLAGTASEAVGMMVYNTNASITNGNGVGVYVWDGNNWKVSAGGGVGQSGVLDSIRGAKGTYKICCFPASSGLGCWMVDNSMEGTPSATTYPGQAPGPYGYFYSAAQSASACLPGWHVPTPTEWKLLAEYMNTHTASPNDWYWWDRGYALVGGYNSSQPAWNGWGIHGMWFDSSGTSTAWQSLGFFHTGNAVWNTCLFPVRCKK